MIAMTDAAQIPPILAHMIKAKAKALGSFTVLTFVDVAPDGSLVDEARTYDDLWRRGCALAQVLIKKGVRPGDRFALVMQNHPEFVDAMVAASILGAVFVPVDPRTKGDKLAYMLDFAECSGAIVADYAWANLSDVLPRLTRLTWIATVGRHPVASADLRTFALKEAIDKSGSDDIEIASNDSDATMQLLYTSGTTGDPKAIVATHRRFAEAGMLGLMLGLKSDDRLYTGLSLTHANAQLITLGMAIQMGIPAVISRKFTKSRLWDITRKYGCTIFNLLGGMTVELYSQPPQPNDADNPVRMVLSAGMPAALWENFAKRFGVQVFEFYGAAEGGLTLNPPGIGPIGSVGKPPPNLELAILDDDGFPVPAGAPGEICFRPAAGAAAVRYFKNEDASQEKTAQGWLHSGDIGHVDAVGWLYFDHRKGDDIRRNGEFISPGFVEKAIAEHPQVADVFVYGVPARSGAPGEKDVVAAIVPTDRAKLDPNSVFAHCRRVLEANAVPSFLQVVSEIPKTASEKPQERILRERLAAGGPDIYPAECAVAA